MSKEQARPIRFENFRIGHFFTNRIKSDEDSQVPNNNNNDKDKTSRERNPLRNIGMNNYNFQQNSR